MDELDDIPTFASRIKAKHPEYADVEDYELTERIIRKHPVYASQVKLPPEFKLLQTTSGYPQIDDLYEKAGREHNVDPNLILEQGRKETAFKPENFYGTNKSTAGAQGAGQFMPGTAPLYGVKDRTNPIQSINGQAKYMRKLLDDFDNDEDLALAGYNAGEHRKSLKNGQIPNIPETQDYVKVIKERLAEARKNMTLRAPVQRPPILPPPVTPDVPVAPVTEAPATIEAQIMSVRDGNSPKAAVLITDANQAALIDKTSVQGFKRVITPQGILYVNPIKAKKLGVTDYANSIPALIGKVEAIPDTSQGPAVLTTDAAGNELSASLVTSPQTVQAQAQIDAAAYPQAAQTQVVDAQDVVAKREADLLREQQIAIMGHPIDTLGGTSPIDPAYAKFLQDRKLPDDVNSLDAFNIERQAEVDAQTDATKEQDRVKYNAAIDTEAAQQKAGAKSVAPPAGESKISTTFDRQIGTATDDQNREIGTTDVPASLSPEQKLRTAMSAQLSKYDVTPQEIDTYIKQHGQGDIQGLAGNPNITKVAVPYRILAQIKGEDAAKYDIRSEQAQGRTDPNVGVDLRVGEDWVKQDAEWLKSTLGEYPAKAVGVILGGGGDTARNLAGLARFIPTLKVGPGESPADLIQNWSDSINESTGSLREQTKGPGGVISQVIELADPSMWSRFILLSRLPGGAITAMTVEGATAAAGTKGSSWKDIGLAAAKGAVIGAIFHQAYRAGGVAKYAVGTATKNKLAQAVAQKAGESIGVLGGVKAASTAFGASDEQSDHEAIVATLFHAYGTFKQAIVGKGIRMRSKDGKETDVTVTPEGEVKLLKGFEEVNPDIEVVYNAKTGMYEKPGETGPVRSKAVPERVETSQEPRQLEEYNPQRIEKPDPAAVQKVSLDTRARKIVDALRDRDFTTIEDVAKAAKVNKVLAEDSLMTLYGAGMVELLPGNRVRLVKEATQPADLFERAKTYGKTPEISPQSAPISKTTVLPVSKPTAQVPAQATGNTVSVKSEPETPAAQITEAVAPDIQAQTEKTYESLPEQKQQMVEPEKPKAKVITLERPDTAKTLNVFTERGTKASIEPKVIDSKDVLTSMDEGYPPEFQPRDRSRIASKAQISDIANKLNPEFLGDSPKAGDGRPLVVPVEINGQTKYAVISGNGRTQGIREAYAAGNEPSKEYAKFAQSKGGTSENPVYVGILDPKEIGDLTEFAREANESSTAQMSATEQAKADAERMTPEVMASFVPADDGSIHGAANRDFTRAFLETVGPAEQGRLIQPDGSLNQDGISRVRNAIFAKAFGDTAKGVQAIQRMAESTSDSVKNVTTAMLGASGPIATYKESAKQGSRHKDYEISNDLAAAVAEYAKLKSPDSAFKTLDEYISQGNLFGADTTPFQTRVMQMFDQNKRSPKAIRAIIGNFLDTAEALGDPNQSNLFGKNETPSVESVFESALKSYARQSPTAPEAEQSALFTADQRVQSRSGRSEEVHDIAAPRPETEAGERRDAARTVAKTQVPEPAPDIPANKPLGKPIPPFMRSVVRRELGKGHTAEEIADTFDLDAEAIAELRSIHEKNVGKFGQTSHFIRRALAVDDNAPLINKIAKLVVPKARIHENNPWFSDTVTSVNAILDTIADSVGKLRSSQMDKADWNKALDAYADKWPQEVTYIINDAVAHQEEWYRKLEAFTNDPELAVVMKKVEDIGNLPGGWQELSTVEWGNQKESTLPAAMKKEVRRIGEKYGIEKVGEARSTGLSEPVVKQRFLESVRKRASEELARRSGATGDREADAAKRQAGDDEAAKVSLTDFLFSVADAPFYSQLERTLEQKMPKSATAEQVRGILKDTKSEERDWLGIDEYLVENPKVGKEDLLNFVRTNQVKVEEVVKGGETDEYDFPKLKRILDSTGEAWGVRGIGLSKRGDNYFVVHNGSTRVETTDFAEVQDYIENSGEISKPDLTKFSQYTLPGGTSYKEMLLVMPPNRKDISFADYLKKHREIYSKGDASEADVRKAYDAGMVLPEKASPRMVRAQMTGDVFKSSHFDEPNILAHIRFDERTVDGKKTLHIAEIQSDWHQAGRKKGYKRKDPLTSLPEGFTAIRRPDGQAGNMPFSVLNPNGDIASYGQSEAGAIENYLDEANDQTTTVPDAPFKKSWQELAFKKALRHAVENDFDAVSWDTGETQVERYNLANYLDRIEYEPTDDGNYELWAFEKDALSTRDPFIHEDEISLERVEELVGKDIAQKIQASEGKHVGGVYRDTRELSGLDLKVGGEGMKGFYDRILSSFVSKYVKKWNSKVEAGILPSQRTKNDIASPIATGDDNYAILAGGETHNFHNFEEAEAFRKEYNRGDVPVHSVQITPQMRESIRQGQPLFNLNDAPGAVQLAREIRKLNLVEPNKLASAARGKIDDDAVLTANPEGGSILLQAIQQLTESAKPVTSTGFYAKTAVGPALVNQLLINARANKNRDYHNFVQTVADALRQTGEHRDLTVVIKSPESTAASKFTRQEELTHRENARSGARSVFVDIAETSSIKKAIENISAKGYANISLVDQVDEVIAKSHRDNAAAELGISEDEVWENLNTFGEAANNAGIDLEPYANISESAGKFYESKRGQRNVESQPEREGIRDSNSTNITEARQGRDSRSPDTRPFREDDGGQKLRQASLSSADREGIESLISPKERHYIELKTRENNALAKAVADEIMFSRASDALQGAKSVAIDLLNAPRAIKASSDLSAGRQAAILIPANPVLFIKAFAKQFQMLPPRYGKRKFEEFKRDMDLHPYIELAEASKLHLTSLGDGSMSSREEAFMSQILGDDPYFKNKALETARKVATFPIRASERAYVTLLDKLRIDVFAKLSRQVYEYNLRKGRENDPTQFEGIARFINYATGRGDLGKYLNDAAPILNALFFSPRYWASRLQVLNPAFYAKLPPGARSIAIKNMLAFVGAVGILMALLKAAGFDVELGDEQNPDMMKLRLGNYSYDFTAGLIGHLRYMAKMIGAARENPKDKRSTADKMTYLTGRYMRAKLAPIPAGAYNAAAGKNFIGEPTSVKEEVALLFQPITVDNFIDAARADGSVGIIKTVPEFFGIGATRFKQIDELKQKIAQERAKVNENSSAADRKETDRRIKLWQALINRSVKYAKERAK